MEIEVALPGFHAELALAPAVQSYATAGNGERAAELGVTPAIRRSCGAIFHLTSLQGGGAIEAEPFSARRGCGRTVPNRCRRRARDSCKSCFQAAWRDRFIRGRPRECTELSSVSGFQGDVGLAAMVRRHVCQLFHARDQTVIVRGLVRGDTGCSSATELGTLHVRCP